MMAKTAQEFLGTEVIEALRRPILDQARGLPAAIYTSDEFFQLEQQRLFARTWVGVAFASDIPAIGDAMPLNVSGLPVILVRGQDNTIRAFHNVCRHRATIILENPCKSLTHLQCSYHAWTYDLEGKLKATPFWDGTANSHKLPVDAANNSLVPIACEVWCYVIFLNLNSNGNDKPVPLLDYLAPMQRELEPLDFAQMEFGHQVEWDFKANWKLVMENWEVYHHIWVHEGVFDKMSDEVDLRTGEPYTDMLADGNTMMLKANAKRPPRQLKGASATLPPLPQKQSSTHIISVANAVLPNTTVTIGPVAYAPAIYTPLTPDSTRVRMAWYFAPGAGQSAQHAAGREAIFDRWLGPSRQFSDRQGIRPQDHRCMELQQAARCSPVANDVKFSTTWEANVRYFQDWLIRTIDA